MKKPVRRILSCLLVIGVTASIVVASIAPLLTPPESVAQTNPQTTDVFTGQFIPAYYGAAYDPSEAYKHMAGSTVYVFAYDTWGRVVNNFAYKTQVRADGSFQAAGLPNASHYGIYFPDEANKLTNYFRVPREEDKLQASFAYQQAVFPGGDEEGEGEEAAADEIDTPNTQILNEKVPDTIKGASIFLTSSKNLDIQNHINIFPLVPMSILSVIIKDPLNSSDFANYNKPYEIYAQRVASRPFDETTSTPYNECAVNAMDECGEIPDTTLTAEVTNGPVIRGRSIYYTPTTGENNDSCGAATIFQAFAPSGTYAITYWRPDGRDAQNQITYLNFNGSQSLNTPYNGIAVEPVASVVNEAPEVSWGELSNRCVRDDDASLTSDGVNFWTAHPSSANLWGMLYMNENNRKSVVSNAGRVAVSDNTLKFVDPTTRKCAENGTKEGNVTALGIFIFSTCNVRSDTFTTRLRVMDGAAGGSPLEQGGDSAGSGLAAALKTNEGIEVAVNGQEGPAKKSIGIVTESDEGATGQLVIGSKPVGDTWLSLLANGRIFHQVAKTDLNGNFVIGKNYFRDRRGNDYKVIVHTSLGESAFREFTIDPNSLEQFRDSNLNLGTIALDKEQNQFGQFLASLNLQNFFDQFRIQPALAQYNPDGATWGLDGDLFANDEWVFYLDTSSLFGQQSEFTPANYSLRHADIKVPPGYEEIRNCMKNVSVRDRAETECGRKHNAANQSAGTNYADIQFGLNYNLFERSTSESTGSGGTGNTEGAQYGRGMVTASGGANEEIIAVALQPDDGDASKVGNHLNYFLNLLGPDPVVFTLRVKFEYTPTVDETPQTEEEIENLSGQSDVSVPPKVLTAEWPIFIQSDGGGYKVTYDRVALTPEGGDVCPSDLSWKDFAGHIEKFFCNAVLGGISAIKGVFDFLADYILHLNPLGFSTVTHFWNMIRNIVNSLVIFILIAAGIAIMFRYEPKIFNIRSVITKLIVAVVLVNFSILIVQVAVDVTNVIAYGGYRFLVNSISIEDIGGTGLAAAGGALAALGVAALGAMIAATGGVGGVLGVILFFLAIVLFFGYVIIRIGLDYALRLATLWICIVLAPVAFASRVMPGTEKYFGRWKGILLGTLVAQVTVAFMIALAIGMLKIGVAESGFFNSLLTLLLAFAIFYYATIAPRKVAAMVGEDLSAGLSSMVKKGAVGAWGLGQKQKLSIANRRALKADRERKRLPTGLRGSAQRLNLRRKRVGYSGLALGVSPEDMDKVEKEARAQAEAEYDTISYDQFPHRSEIEDKEAHEKQAYQTADNTAGMFSRGKLTNARDNTSLVDGRYDYTLDNLDAAGNVRKQNYIDSSGAAAVRDQVIGDLSDFDRGENASVYAQGFKQVFDDQVDKLGSDASKSRARGAIQEAKNWITTGSHAGGNGMNENMKGFFDNFEYQGQRSHKAWATFYRDIGEDIDPEVAKYPDMYGKVTEDFVYRAAGKGDSAWEASLRTANSQAKSGISSRHRIDINATPDLQLPGVPAGAAMYVPGRLPGGIELTTMPPANTYITGAELKPAMDAIKIIKQAYDDLASPAHRVTNDRAYRNAVTALRRLGYS